MEMGSTEHKADCNLLIKLDRHDKERGPFRKEMIALDPWCSLCLDVAEIAHWLDLSLSLHPSSQTLA